MVVVEASSDKVVDIWIHPASSDKGFQEPIPWGVAQREDLIADRGFDGPEVMTAGRGKGDASQRQYVESVISVVRNSLRLPWKKVIQSGAISMPGPLPSKG